MHPPSPEPETCAIAILDLLGYKSHLWDEAGSPKPNALASLYETFFLWLTATDYGRSFNRFTLTADGKLARVEQAIDYVVASDTMMLWAPRDKAQYLLAATARLFIRALGWGAPLRGAIGFGDCILDFERHIVIGYPIVEAVEAEKRQDWLGVCVLPSAAAALAGNTGIVPYEVPVKQAYSQSSPSLQHALAWHWAEEVPNAAEIYLTRLASAAPCGTRQKYKRALAFIRRIGAQPAG
jgi:hypothetical protein